MQHKFFGLIAVSALLSATLSGCATPYGDARNPITGWTGGYSESKGPGELIKVIFSGNGIIKTDTVSVYLLYRCAEIAQREGKPYFAFYQNLPDAVLDKKSTSKSASTVGRKPTDYAYILLSKEDKPGYLSASAVISSLEIHIKPEGGK